MRKKSGISASLLLAAAVLAGCEQPPLTAPEVRAVPEEPALARLLQQGQFEEPCGSVVSVALRNEAGEVVGEVTIWNGPSKAYARLRAEPGWEFTEVRVGGALQAEQFPGRGGVVNPRRFQFGGRVRPAQAQVVIEALHRGNPYDVQPGDEVLVAVFARLQPVGGGASISAWAEGTPFEAGEPARYFRYTLLECPVIDPSTITAGIGHTCGLSPAGRAYCWGWNSAGQLGDGTRTERYTPTAVSGGLTFAAISAGAEHTCGVTPDGRAYCWGMNVLRVVGESERFGGQLGDGTLTDRRTPTAVVGGLTFAEISAGWTHTCGVTTDGQAYCWGAGGLGDGTTTGRLTPTAVAGGLSFAAISAGYGHTCALTPEGRAYCWGGNWEGPLGDGTRTDRHTPTAVAGGLTFAAISARWLHTCGLTPAGRAYCWGLNRRGQLGDGTTTNRHTPTAVGGGLTFAAISAGAEHTCGVTPDGRAYCWGVNWNGQLGDGTTTQRHTPTAVAGGLSFATVSTGGGTACGLTTAGRAYCWGSNERGQLGDGTRTDRHTPTPVVGWADLASSPPVQ